MNENNRKAENILVVILAVLTIVLCAVVIFMEFPGQTEEVILPTPTPMPTATPEPTPEPTANPYEEKANAIIAEMSLDEKVWQLFIATPEEVADVDEVTRSGDGMKAGLERFPVGGLVYDRSNANGESQVKEMLSGAQDRSQRAMFITFDMTDGDSSAVTVTGHYKSLGFNLSLESSESDVLTTVRYADGVDLSAADLVLVGSDAAEDGTPAFFSASVVTDKLRSELGWNGLVITDALDSSALDSYTQGEMAIKAIQAGCDIINSPSDLGAAGQAIMNAVSNGDITEERLHESVRRVLCAKFEAGILS